MNILKWFALALIILVLILILVFITKLTVFFSFYHGQDNDHLKLKFKIWFGLITYKINIPLIKVADDAPAIVFKEEVQSGMAETPKEETKKFSVNDFIKGIYDFKELLQHVIAMHKIVRHFLRKVSLRKLEWHSVIGVGDAALTGTLTGALWSVKGGFLGIISNYMKLRDMPNMSITPSFQRAYSQTQLSCMIQFRIGNAIVAGLKLVKYWKGGKPKFKTKPLSFLSKDKTKTV